MGKIDHLRKVAELNLCSNCFERYKALIEPTVRNYLFSPLIDWRRTEFYICVIAMRTAGAYKTEVSVIPRVNDKEDLGEEYNQLINEVIYKRIKRWGFKKRIDYLHEEQVIGHTAYSILVHAKNIRNKIHDDIAEFSNEDLNIFEMAHTLASQYFYAMVTSADTELSKSIKSNAELLAKEMINRFDLNF